MSHDSEDSHGPHGVGGWVRLVGCRASVASGDPTNWFGPPGPASPDSGTLTERAPSRHLPAIHRRPVA